MNKKQCLDDITKQAYNDGYDEGKNVFSLSDVEGLNPLSENFYESEEYSYPAVSNDKRKIEWIEKAKRDCDAYNEKFDSLTFNVGWEYEHGLDDGYMDTWFEVLKNRKQ